jgi:hypothetical protein
MIYLYDDKGAITAEYEDWKLRDVELDIHNGSLSGAVLQAEDIKHFKFADGRYTEKSVDEKYSEKLITKKERDDAVALTSAAAREVLIQEKMRAMAEAELKKEGK